MQFAMKKLIFFTFVLILTGLLPWGARAAEPTTFLDVPRSHEFFLPIQYFSAQEVIRGYEDNTFKSDNPVNRAEALKLILTAAATTLPTTLDRVPFGDMTVDDWFARYVVAGVEAKVISGEGDQKTFSPGRQVNQAEFLKMLFLANKVDVSGFAKTDAPSDTWFAPFIGTATQLGIIASANPTQFLTRGESLEMMYLLMLVKKGKDTQFLLSRAEENLSQIEVYIAANRVDLAKKASALAVDISQQALKNKPQNSVVLGGAKLARAYDFLVDAFQLGIAKKFTEAADKANQAIAKATEAWEANKVTEPVSKHIKDRAREILNQVGGQETPAANSLTK